MAGLVDKFEWYQLMHMARIAKYLDILDAWGRNFLFNIGKKKKEITWGYKESNSLSVKQESIFDKLFTKILIELDGISD